MPREMKGYKGGVREEKKVFSLIYIRYNTLYTCLLINKCKNIEVFLLFPCLFQNSFLSLHRN